MLSLCIDIFMTLALKHIQKVKALETQEMCKSFFFSISEFQG